MIWSVFDWINTVQNVATVVVFLHCYTKCPPAFKRAAAPSSVGFIFRSWLIGIMLCVILSSAFKKVQNNFKLKYWMPVKWLLNKYINNIAYRSHSLVQDCISYHLKPAQLWLHRRKRQRVINGTFNIPDTHKMFCLQASCLCKGHLLRWGCCSDANATLGKTNHYFGLADMVFGGRTDQSDFIFMRSVWLLGLFPSNQRCPPLYLHLHYHF